MQLYCIHLFQASSIDSYLNSYISDLIGSMESFVSFLFISNDLSYLLWPVLFISNDLSYLLWPVLFISNDLSYLLWPVLFIRNDGADITGSVSKKFYDKFEAGLNINWVKGAACSKFGVAAKYTVDTDTTFRVRRSTLLYTRKIEIIYINLVVICCSVQ